MATNTPLTTSLGDIECILQRIYTFIQPYLPLANINTVGFYTENLWLLLPNDVRAELLSLNDQELSCLPTGQNFQPELRCLNEKGDSQSGDGVSDRDNTICSPPLHNHVCHDIRSEREDHVHDGTPNTFPALQKFFSEAQKYTLKHLQLVKDIEDVLQQDVAMTTDRRCAIVGFGMSQKKYHEVTVMADVVNKLAQRFGAKQIVDIGSGKGYLSQHLSLQYGLQVLGIDASNRNTVGAMDRNRKLTKFWPGLTKTSSEPKMSQRTDVCKCKHKPVVKRNVDKVLVKDKDHIPLEDKGKIPVTDKDEILVTDNELPVTDKWDIPVMNKDKIPVTDKDQIPVTDKDEIPVSVKDEIPVTDKNQIPVTDEDKMPVTDKDEMSVTDKVEIPVTDKDTLPEMKKCDIQATDKNEMLATDKYETPVTNKCEKPVTDKDKMLVTDKSEILVTDNELPVTDKGDIPITDKVKIPVTDKDEIPVTDKGEIPVTDNKLPTDEGDIPVTDKDKIPVTDKSKIPVKDKNGLPLRVRNEDEIPVTDKDEIPVTTKDEELRHLATEQTNLDSSVKNEKRRQNVNNVCEICKKIILVSYNPVTAFVDVDTDLSKLKLTECKDNMMDSVSSDNERGEEHSEVSSHSMLLTGLHTCGDLAATILRLFSQDPSTKILCSVGCCFNLLTEEFDDEPPWGVHPGSNVIPGFPMSNVLKSQRAVIGRGARRLACSSNDKAVAERKLPSNSLFIRAVLQVIIEDHYGSFRGDRPVGKTAAKCKTFLEYVRKALKKLQLDDTKLSDADIMAYHKKYENEERKLACFIQFRAILAPVIEGFILLDRLAFLLQQDDVESADIVQIFDPVTSPRCHAIIATKR